MSTVYAKQYGRTGNNLFQKAAVIGYAVKHGIAYDTEPWPRIVRPVLPQTGIQKITEQRHNYQELPAPIKSHILLEGYWQSEKYFTHCREAILRVFADKFRWNWNFSPGWCSIHVRRGDYLKYPDKHPVVSDVYLCKAIQHMSQINPRMHFTFFSDDIPWCRQFVNEWREAFPVIQFEFSEGKSEESDLFLMSCHQHQIISNSTFSWWGAWLNQNPDKVVISPSKDNWFGPGNAHLDTSDLIPDSWIQIKY